MGLGGFWFDRKGKKIFDKSFKEDRVKAKARGNAYIIGNGPSRKDFDLNKLPATGQTYGCNALYREFAPDMLISVDPGMHNEILATDYIENNKVIGLPTETVYGLAANAYSDEAVKKIFIIKTI